MQKLAIRWSTNLYLSKKPVNWFQVYVADDAFKLVFKWVAVECRPPFLLSLQVAAFPELCSAAGRTTVGTCQTKSAAGRLPSPAGRKLKSTGELKTWPKGEPQLPIPPRREPQTLRRTCKHAAPLESILFSITAAAAAAAAALLSESTSWTATWREWCLITDTTRAAAYPTTSRMSGSGSHTTCSSTLCRWHWLYIKSWPGFIRLYMFMFYYVLFMTFIMDPNDVTNVFFFKNK